MFATTIASPIGTVTVGTDGKAVVRVSIGGDADAADDGNDPLLREAVRQLRAYFDGELTAFALPLSQEGTEFQQRVWKSLSRIPFGETISYADLARRVGNPRACRAVGSANGRNRIAIVIPCHRVIAADGTIGGYGGGLDVKEWLIRHEHRAG